MPVTTLRWPAKLTGPELQEARQRVAQRLPQPRSLAQMLRFGLNENLDAIAAAGNLRATVFEVVSHAEAQGYIPALFDAALATAPGNPELLALAATRRA